MKSLLSICLTLLLFCGCTEIMKQKPDESVTPMTDPAAYEYTAPIDVTPDFAAVTELSSLIDSEPEFEESKGKETLTLQDNKLGEYVFSAYQLHITPEMKLSYSCTWASSGCKVFFGLLNSDNEVFVVSAEGGTLRGTLSMEDVPEDDYQLILYSNNNPEVQAILHYQFF